MDGRTERSERTDRPDDFVRDALSLSLSRSALALSCRFLSVFFLLLSGNAGAGDAAERGEFQQPLHFTYDLRTDRNENQIVECLL